MKKREHRLTAEHLMRVGGLRGAHQRTLLKSLLQTRATPLAKKVVWSHKEHRRPLVLSICRQNTRCLHNGRPRGVQTLVGLSRHTLKLWAAEGRVHLLRSRL